MARTDPALAKLPCARRLRRPRPSQGAGAWQRQSRRTRRAEIASLARNVANARFGRHRVLDEPDDRREDRAGDAANHRLADDPAGDAAARRLGDDRGRSGEQRNQSREERSAGRADDRVADRAEVDVLELRTDEVTTERASNELDDKVDHYSRHASPPWRLSRRRSRSRNATTVKLTNR